MSLEQRTNVGQLQEMRMSKSTNQRPCDGVHVIAKLLKLITCNYVSKIEVFFSKLRMWCDASLSASTIHAVFFCFMYINCLSTSILCVIFFSYFSLFELNIYFLCKVFKFIWHIIFFTSHCNTIWKLGSKSIKSIQISMKTSKETKDGKLYGPPKLTIAAKYLSVFFYWSWFLHPF